MYTDCKINLRALALSNSPTEVSAMLAQWMLRPNSTQNSYKQRGKWPMQTLADVRGSKTTTISFSACIIVLVAGRSVRRAGPLGAVAPRQQWHRYHRPTRSLGPLSTAKPGDHRPVTQRPHKSRTLALHQSSSSARWHRPGCCSKLQQHLDVYQCSKLDVQMQRSGR